MKTGLLFFISLWICKVTFAQSIWSIEHLEKVKHSLIEPKYNEPYKVLIKEADNVLAP